MRDLVDQRGKVGSVTQQDLAITNGSTRSELIEQRPRSGMAVNTQVPERTPKAMLELRAMRERLRRTTKHLEPNLVELGVRGTASAWAIGATRARRAAVALRLFSSATVRCDRRTAESKRSAIDDRRQPCDGRRASRGSTSGRLSLVSSEDPVEQAWTELEARLDLLFLLRMLAMRGRWRG